MNLYHKGLRLHRSDFQLQTRTFESRHHASLQDMWYRAHYKEAENVRGRSLGESALILVLYFHFQSLLPSWKPLGLLGPFNTTIIDVVLDSNPYWERAEYPSCQQFKYVLSGPNISFIRCLSRSCVFNMSRLI